VDSRADLDDVEKRKFLTLLGLELRPLGRSARSQSLYRLLYPGSPGEIYSDENSVELYQTTPCHIAEDGTLHNFTVQVCFPSELDGLHLYVNISNNRKPNNGFVNYSLSFVLCLWLRVTPSTMRFLLSCS
jgi:hypothetical protein